MINCLCLLHSQPLSAPSPCLSDRHSVSRRGRTARSSVAAAAAAARICTHIAVCPFLLCFYLLVPAEREEESEQEEGEESPSSGTPIVIVIQPNVQIHMPEGSMMQRPEHEAEKGEEEQMDQPPSSSAAPMSLRQSATKVKMLRQRVAMLESKLAAMRSKLGSDSSLALPIARARRQLMRARLSLAMAERRHTLLRHRMLKEHESKLMKPDELKLKLQHGQTAETASFDTQG